MFFYLLNSSQCLSSWFQTSVLSVSVHKTFQKESSLWVHIKWFCHLQQLLKHWRESYRLQCREEELCEYVCVWTTGCDVGEAYCSHNVCVCAAVIGGGAWHTGGAYGLHLGEAEIQHIIQPNPHPLVLQLPLLSVLPMCDTSGVLTDCCPVTGDLWNARGCASLTDVGALCIWLKLLLCVCSSIRVKLDMHLQAGTWPKNKNIQESSMVWPSFYDVKDARLELMEPHKQAVLSVTSTCEVLTVSGPSSSSPHLDLIIWRRNTRCYYGLEFNLSNSVISWTNQHSFHQQLPE